ncbi:MAG: hypothetical protein Q8N47_01425, partial [Bryobacterales bacterium]|nr:hypothetical protein [Bryobacterales bacterium]
MKRRRGAVIALNQTLLFCGLIGAAEPPAPVYVKDGDLQAALDRAPAYATVVADRAATIEIASTVRISKPLTLAGLNARMKPGVGKTPMLVVAAEGVRIRDFLLEGNAESVPQSERAPLIEVRRGRFVIENGEANHSSKDGVMITPVAESDWEYRTSFSC